MMKPALLILTLVGLLTLSFSRKLSIIEASQNTVTITFISPTPAGLSDTNLNIVVAINSLYQLSTVRGKVEDREKDLTFSTCAYRTRLGECQPGWLATISLAGLERGQKSLSVSATDVFNTVSTAQVTFRYDQPPKVVLEGLPDGAIARPDLRFKASCVDDDPAGCRSLVAVFSSGNVVAQLPNQFDGEISFAKANGIEGDFCIRATDSAFQVREICQKLYVEASPVLTEVLKVNGIIQDVKTDRVLYAEKRDGREVLRIFNRLSGEDQELTTISDGKLYTLGTEPTTYLTPRGAIFVIKLDNDFWGYVREWRDGLLIEHGKLNASDSLKVNGKYAIWNRNQNPDQTSAPIILILRDLESGTNTEILGGSVGNWRNVVTETGDVYFWAGGSGDYRIFRYHNGQSQMLTDTAGVRDVYPVTDGSNVVFRRLRGSTSDPDYQIVLLNNDSEKILASGSERLPGPLGYMVKNGWVAFSRPGATGAIPVWLRSPDGQEVQKSFFQSPTYVDSLSADGQLTFYSNDLKRRYLPLNNLPPIEIGTTLGRPFWQDEKLFVIIGNSLFQFTPPASVSAASYSAAALAPEAITAVFGSKLATATRVATTQPLPTSLEGTSITVRDKTGAQRLAPLFFVSPDQINYQIPQGTVAGTSLITINSGDGLVSSGTLQISSVAPSLFTANASGQGVPAATLLRVKANGEQIYEPVAVFDQNQNQFVPRPIDFGPESDQLFLILFGTGFRYRSALSAATATVGGTNAEVVFAGTQGDFTGLDQANIRLPRNLSGRGNVELNLSIDGKSANPVMIHVK